MDALRLLQFEEYGAIAQFTRSDAPGASCDSFASLNLGLHVGDDPEVVQKNRRIAADIAGISETRIVYAEQVHGARVAVVHADDAGRGAFDTADAIKGVDGLVSTARGLLLAILAADCTPVLFYDPYAGVIGAAHAGWKGTAQGVVMETIKEMKKLGANPEDMLVALGPAIRGCCYEVDQPVTDALEDMYRKLATREPIPFRVSERAAERTMVDLPTLARLQAEQLGVPHGQVIDTSICTHCMPGFFSHRKLRGKAGRHAGFIAIKPRRLSLRGRMR